MKEKTIFIAIEGSDGSGKETQTILLENRLLEEGYKVKRISFPAYGTKQAILAEEYLSGSFGDSDPKLASICFAVDRKITLRTENLEEYDFIIFDRYVKSNIIHQGRNFVGQQKEEFIKWVEELEYNMFDIPREDIAIFLNMPPEYSFELISKRTGKAGIKNDILENLEEMKKAYSNAMSVVEITNMHKINCVEDGKMKTREMISNEIYDYVFSKNEKV